MEDHKRIAADGGFQLPQEIIQQIQSLMREGDAARTTLLSKSWHGAWSTRPHLSFDQHEFRNRIDEFPRFTKKTLQRYEDLNQNIKTFKLWMEGNHSLAAELILKAIKLGANDLTIQIPTSGTTSFVLPDEVLESQTLAKLSVFGLIVDLQRRRRKEVTCSNLKSLTLFNATVNGDLFRDLISRCPLIEELKWDQPRILSGEERILFDDCRIKLEEFNKLKFHKLKYLRLNGLDVEDALYRHDLCPKFPCLKNLVIWDCCSDDVRICSPSLEHITIRKLHKRIWNGEFDVPNIRKFKVSSSKVPRLVIKTSSREWESDIDINGKLDKHVASWFSSLNRLVKMLSLSRVSLSLSVDIERCRGRIVYVGDGLPIPAVENLTLYCQSVTPDFLNSLFWSCRPNFVKIEKRCVFGMAEVNVKVFQQLRSLPWKTLSDDSSYQQGSVRFQLN